MSPSTTRRRGVANSTAVVERRRARSRRLPAPAGRCAATRPGSAAASPRCVVSTMGCGLRSQWPGERRRGYWIPCAAIARADSGAQIALELARRPFDDVVDLLFALRDLLNHDRLDRLVV